MKAIKMRIQKLSRPVVILMATVVAIITSMVVANATQTITTPNAAFVSWSLTAGTNSAAITPVTNKSVLVMGCTLGTGSPGDQGVAHVSLLHIPSTAIFWVGLESVEAFSSGAITQGASNIEGTHIVYLDQNHKVDIEVNNADTIFIHNGDSSTRAGNVTLVW